MVSVLMVKCSRAFLRSGVSRGESQHDCKHLSQVSISTVLKEEQLDRRRSVGAAFMTAARHTQTWKVCTVKRHLPHCKLYLDRVHYEP